MPIKFERWLGPFALVVTISGFGWAASKWDSKIQGRLDVIQTQVDAMQAAISELSKNNSNGESGALTAQCAELSVRVANAIELGRTTSVGEPLRELMRQLNCPD